jgi:hypothetical protein
MMVDRSLNRFSHGSMLAEKQGIQWMIADSTMELYQAKLMVLHAAYRIDNKLDFKSEVSMAKHFVANMLGRVIDRSIQVHGALGYSTDTPLAHMYQHARWARFADGADEIHQMRIAQRTIAAYRDHGSTRTATGDLPIYQAGPRRCACQRPLPPCSPGRGTGGLGQHHAAPVLECLQVRELPRVEGVPVRSVVTDPRLLVAARPGVGATFVLPAGIRHQFPAVGGMLVEAHDAGVAQVVGVVGATLLVAVDVSAEMFAGLDGRADHGGVGLIGGRQLCPTPEADAEGKTSTRVGLSCGNAGTDQQAHHDSCVQTQQAFPHPPLHVCVCVCITPPY